MFHPFRYKKFAVYDIRQLIAPTSNIEERICLEATKRIPYTFQIGEPWGQEYKEGTLWIDEKEHDTTYKKIRSRLRVDIEYIRKLNQLMQTDILNLALEIKNIKNEELDNYNFGYILNACAVAKSWFATNWLHPFFSVKMSIAKCLGENLVESSLNILLKGEIMPTFIQAYSELLNVKDLSSDEEFRNQWGGLYALGSHEGSLWSQGSALSLASEKSPTKKEIEFFTEKNKRNEEHRKSLIHKLIYITKANEGQEAADLLKAQIEYITTIVWEEEFRHLFEQQTYALYRRWYSVAKKSAIDDTRYTANWSKIA